MHIVRYAPESVEELVHLLTEDAEHLRVLAGGTELAPKLRAEKTRPHGLIWLGSLEAARGIRVIDDGVEIGAMTTMTELAASDMLKGAFGALAQAAGSVGSEQIRGMATLGGSIVSASQKTDMLPPLLLLDAELQVAGSEGVDWRPAASVLPGGEKTLKRDEILISARLMRRTGEWRSVFCKLGSRQTMTFARLSLALGFRFKGETIKESRAFLGALGPVPIEVPDIRKTLNGRSTDEKAAQILAKAFERFIRANVPEGAERDYAAWAIKAVTADAMAKIEM